MKDFLKMIGDPLLRIVLWLMYMPFAAVAVMCGAFALSLQRLFSLIINGKDYESDTYEDMLTNLLSLFL
jgi:hypothetical protein